MSLLLGGTGLKLPAAGGGSFSIAYQDEQINISDTGLTTYSFTGVDFGAEDANREIIIAAVGNRQDITDITVAGDSGAPDVSNGTPGGYLPCAVRRVALPTGTSGTVSVTHSSANGGRTKIYVFRALNVSAITDSISVGEQASVATISGTLSTTSGGAVIMIAAERGGWTGFSETGVTQVGTISDLDSSDECFCGLATGVSASASYAVQLDADSGTGNIAWVVVSLE